MSKKILASVLAAASILSISAVASATGGDTTPATESTINGQASADGTSYDVSADVSLGTVNVTLPTAEAFKGETAIVVNPYGAAVKSKDEDNNDIANTSFVASPAYAIKNNDKDGGLKVIATVSVKKATGLVIVDPDTEAPLGWATGTLKDGTTPSRVKPEGAEAGDYAWYDTYDPLVSYDKVTVTYKKGEEKIEANIETTVGGGVSTKQTNNTAIKLVGAKDASKLNDPAATSADVNTVKFLPKGTNGGTLLELGKATNDSTPAVGYFTVKGEFNPAVDVESYAWGKENLSLNIVLKVIPTVVS